jgi:hypothetical protein
MAHFKINICQSKYYLYDCDCLHLGNPKNTYITIQKMNKSGTKCTELSKVNYVNVKHNRYE